MISQVVKRSQTMYNKRFQTYIDVIIVSKLSNASIIDKICSPVTEARREAILFFSICLRVNSTWLITSEQANQNAQKALFICVVYTNVQHLSSTSFLHISFRNRLWCVLSSGKVLPPWRSSDRLSRTQIPRHCWWQRLK